MLTGNAALPRALALGERPGDLDPADTAMLHYAVKLTRTPGQMSAGDVEALRSHGFDDRGILDICQVVSYYNYVNRLADGVGVELESHWKPEELTVSEEDMALLNQGTAP